MSTQILFRFSESVDEVCKEYGGKQKFIGRSSTEVSWVEYYWSFMGEVALKFMGGAVWRGCFQVCTGGEEGEERGMKYVNGALMTGFLG